MMFNGRLKLIDVDGCVPVGSEAATNAVHVSKGAQFENRATIFMTSNINRVDMILLSYCHIILDKIKSFINLYINVASHA